ncbi:MAG: DUF1800 domain-containing protein [Vicinamibacteria bacterium]
MPAPESLGSRVVLHLLNRAAYGPRPGEIEDVLRRGPTEWIEDQLAPGPDPELDARLAAYPTLSYTTTRVLSLYNADQRSIGVILDELFSAKIVRSVYARYQLQEALVDFWFNHFNVFVNDGFDRYSIGSYERDAIRPRVLGRFRDLLEAASLHPAMLFYLDNYLNTVPRQQGNRVIGGINENQGRELLELHTVGVDAGYTQADVVEASRCLTGHGIDNLGASGNYLYRPANHDNGAKQVFGLSVPAGGGERDVELLFDHLASHPATARFICYRLAQRFVADVPPEGLVGRLAEAFLRTDGDLREVARALFGSPEFWAEAFGSGKPKTGFEYVISVLRATGARLNQTRSVRTALQDAGMPLYACNPPTGYSNRGDDWLNPSAQLYRMNFALDASAGALAGVVTDVRTLIRDGGGDAENPRSAAEAIDREVFGRTLSSSTLAAAARVTTPASVPVSTRVAGVIFAGPEMQVR